MCIQEADNWTTLSADVDDVFESRDIDAVGYLDLELILNWQF